MSGADKLYTRCVVVRGLMLDALIGVHDHEIVKTQPVKIDLELKVRSEAISDELHNVISYEDIVTGIRQLLSDRHYNLTETLAERIADHCLVDPRSVWVRVRVEKPEAIANAEGAGSEITKTRARKS